MFNKPRTTPVDLTLAKRFLHYQIQMNKDFQNTDELDVEQFNAAAQTFMHKLADYQQITENNVNFPEKKNPTRKEYFATLGQIKVLNKKLMKGIAKFNTIEECNKELQHLKHLSLQTELHPDDNIINFRNDLILRSEIIADKLNYLLPAFPEESTDYPIIDEKSGYIVNPSIFPMINLTIRENKSFLYLLLEKNLNSLSKTCLQLENDLDGLISGKKSSISDEISTKLQSFINQTFDLINAAFHTFDQEVALEVHSHEFEKFANDAFELHQNAKNMKQAFNLLIDCHDAFNIGYSSTKEITLKQKLDVINQALESIQKAPTEIKDKFFNHENKLILLFNELNLKHLHLNKSAKPYKLHTGIFSTIIENDNNFDDTNANPNQIVRTTLR